MSGKDDSYYGTDPYEDLPSFETSARRDGDLETFLDNTSHSIQTTLKSIDLLGDARKNLAEAFRKKASLLITLAEELDNKENIFESFYDEALNEQSKATKDMAAAVVVFTEGGPNSKEDGLALLRKAYGRLETAHYLHRQLAELYESYRLRQ